jgi:hypothetical protein
MRAEHNYRLQSGQWGAMLMLVHIKRKRCLLIYLEGQLPYLQTYRSPQMLSHRHALAGLVIRLHTLCCW